MSIVEKILLISACLAPVVALLFVLPKFKKKKKEKPVETTDYVPLEKEKSTQTTQMEVDKQQPIINKDEDLEDYREFLSKRKEASTKPQRNSVPKDFIDRTTSYVPQFQRKNKSTPKDDLNINNLSPELKTLIITGILDRKF